MNLLRRILTYAAPVMLAIVIGCGGSRNTSATTGGSPNALTRTSIKNGYSLNLIGLAQSGAAPMAGGGAGTTGSSGGMGIPFMGAFIRDLAPGGGGGVGLGLHRGVREVGGTTGSGGGTEVPTNFYYDEYLGLWVEWSSTETSYSMLLFLDESKSQAAGSMETTYASDFSSYTSKYEITGGPYSGAKGSYESTIDLEGNYATSFDNTWPNWGHDKGESVWGPNGGSSTYRSEATDGSWFTASSQFSADGSGSSSSEDSAGHKYKFVYNADGGGSGVVEGPEAGLPAKITWTADGHTKIVWADGSVEEFDPWTWVEDGGGTTGTSGSSASP